MLTSKGGCEDKVDLKIEQMRQAGQIYRDCKGALCSCGCGKRAEWRVLYHVDRDLDWRAPGRWVCGEHLKQAVGELISENENVRNLIEKAVRERSLLEPEQVQKLALEETSAGSSST